MPTFPQLSTGAVTQFPFQAEVRFRSTRYEGPSGGELFYNDPDFEEWAWEITLEDLTDAEWGDLEQLFTSCGGGLGGFTFLNPSANLLKWSENLLQDEWANAGGGTTAGIADPLGGSAAFHLTAGGGGSEWIQSALVPASYRYVGSVWARTGSAGTGVQISDGLGTQAFTPFQGDGVWRRYSVAFEGGAPVGEEVFFSLLLPAGESMDIFGPQLEAQVAASDYKPSSHRSGVHANARFDQEVLSDRSLGPNRHSTRLRIVWTPSLT